LNTTNICAPPPFLDWKAFPNPIEVKAMMPITATMGKILETPEMIIQLKQEYN